MATRLKIGTALNYSPTTQAASGMKDLHEIPTNDLTEGEYPIAGKAINGENRYQGKPKRVWMWEICSQKQWEQLMSFLTEDTLNRWVYIRIPKIGYTTSAATVEHRVYRAIMHYPTYERLLAGKRRLNVRLEFTNLTDAGLDLG